MSTKTDANAHLKLEGTINDVLSGDILRNAMHFAAFLNANNLIPGGPHGGIYYEDNCVCYMHLDGAEQKPGPWTIWTDGDYSREYEEIPMDESMKEIAWANVNFCADCGGSCSPGSHKVIFGKEFDGVCSADMAFNSPNAETLECVKILLSMRKYDIDSAKQW